MDQDGMEIKWIPVQIPSEIFELMQAQLVHALLSSLEKRDTKSDDAAKSEDGVCAPEPKQEPERTLESPEGLIQQDGEAA